MPAHDAFFVSFDAFSVGATWLAKLGGEKLATQPPDDATGSKTFEGNPRDGGGSIDSDTTVFSLSMTEKAEAGVGIGAGTGVVTTVSDVAADILLTLSAAASAFPLVSGSASCVKFSGDVMPGSAYDRDDIRHLGCLKDDGTPAGGGPDEDGFPAALRAVKFAFWTFDFLFHACKGAGTFWGVYERTIRTAKEARC